MFSFRVHETEHGALFSPAQTRVVMLHMSNNIKEEVAKQGNRDVHSHLHQVLKHPTGYYESRVSVDHVGDGIVIDGDNVIYGPWLEGVGSRNATTRFKGYFTFRKVAQALEVKAQHIANRIADREVKVL